MSLYISLDSYLPLFVPPKYTRLRYTEACHILEKATYDRQPLLGILTPLFSQFDTSRLLLFCLIRPRCRYNPCNMEDEERIIRRYISPGKTYLNKKYYVT